MRANRTISKSQQGSPKINPMHSSLAVCRDAHGTGAEWPKSADPHRDRGTNPNSFGQNADINPMQSSSSHWSKGFAALAAAVRCGAKRRAGGSCRSPAMENGRCRMHGGASPGAPLGNRNALKHGQTTADSLFAKTLMRACIRSASAVARAAHHTAQEMRRRRLAAEALLRSRPPAIHSTDAFDETAQEPDA